MTEPTLDDLLPTWLADHGYEGLVSEDLSCACELSDLRPCGDMMAECQPGHKVPCNPDTCDVTSYVDKPCDWHIKAGKKPDDSPGPAGG